MRKCGSNQFISILKSRLWEIINISLQITHNGINQITGFASQCHFSNFNRFIYSSIIGSTVHEKEVVHSQAQNIFEAGFHAIYFYTGEMVDQKIEVRSFTQN